MLSGFCCGHRKGHHHALPLRSRPSNDDVKHYVLIQGGDGNDTLMAGSGDNYLHGGNGDDRLWGYDRTHFFTGEGNDRILHNSSQDSIVAGANDQFDRTQGSTFTQVKPGKAGE